MGPVINSLTLMRVPAILEAHSVPPLDFLSRVGLSPNLLLKGARWLPRDLCFDVAETAMRLTGNRYFGAEVGAAIRFLDLGAYGEKILAAKTVGEALKTAQREIGIVHSAALLRQTTTARESVFHFHFTGNPAKNPLQFELGSLAVMRSIAMLAGEPDHVRIHTTLPRPRSTNALEEFLGGKLEFGQASNAIVVDREILTMQNAGCRQTFVQPELAAITRTAQWIAKLLPEQSATLETVAGRLHLTERTLQRRLAKFGITFEQLLDATRREEAMRLLRENRESLAGIAFQLGYSNQANFNRAFNRWTGNTPMNYRRNGNPD